jgi:hypothetical protein
MARYQPCFGVRAGVSVTPLSQSLVGAPYAYDGVAAVDGEID